MTKSAKKFFVLPRPLLRVASSYVSARGIAVRYALAGLLSPYIRADRAPKSAGARVAAINKVQEQIERTLGLAAHNKAWGLEERRLYALRMNCPPAIGRSKRKHWLLRPCRHRLWCPWCWSRTYVVPALKRTVKLVEKHPDLVAVRVSLTWKVKPGTAKFGDLVDFTHLAKRKINRLVKRPEVVGGVGITTMYYEHGLRHVRCRWLFFARTDSSHLVRAAVGRLRGQFKILDTVVLGGDQGPRRTAKAVGWVASFHPGLLNCSLIEGEKLRLLRMTQGRPETISYLGAMADK